VSLRARRRSPRARTGQEIGVASRARGLFGIEQYAQEDIRRSTSYERRASWPVCNSPVLRRGRPRTSPLANLNFAQHALARGGTSQNLPSRQRQFLRGAAGKLKFSLALSTLDCPGWQTVWRSRRRPAPCLRTWTREIQGGHPCCNLAVTSPCPWCDLRVGAECAWSCWRGSVGVRLGLGWPTIGSAVLPTPFTQFQRQPQHSSAGARHWPRDRARAGRLRGGSAPAA